MSLRKWIPPLIVVASIIASILVYSQLPGSVPTHWDASGRVNGWSDRAWGAFVIPVILLVMWGLIRFLPRIDPRGENYVKFGGAFEGMFISVMLFLLALHFVVLRAALGYHVDMQRIIPIAMGLMFVAIGFFLPRAHPNWFVGIRTPWTLSSDVVWEKTHRLGGKVFVTAGVLIVLSAFIVPHSAHVAMFALIAISAAILLVYSYLEWRREGSPHGTAPRGTLSEGKSR